MCTKRVCRRCARETGVLPVLPYIMYILFIVLWIRCLSVEAVSAVFCVFVSLAFVHISFSASVCLSVLLAAYFSFLASFAKAIKKSDPEGTVFLLYLRVRKEAASAQLTTTIHNNEETQGNCSARKVTQTNTPSPSSTKKTHVRNRGTGTNATKRTLCASAYYDPVLDPFHKDKKEINRLSRVKRACTAQR